MLGGYKQQDESSEEYKPVAEFAVKQLSAKENQDYSLVKVHSVHTQVVAGRNYKLDLEVAGKSDPSKRYEAVVYEPLKGEKQLSSHSAK
ncbi:hypothetical protein WJX72_007568 [[Myrmecia] bisecta]|uniref:Cystatin domain-containing protein n=1 Tax=[Myrmecia] bisecta TaxID=41462 RepID=A0AAW1QFK6_9CHLO